MRLRTGILGEEAALQRSIINCNDTTAILLSMHLQGSIIGIVFVEVPKECKPAWHRSLQVGWPIEITNLAKRFKILIY